ncbi:hypothetical protein GCK32_011083 [Trichostrongylus colubriformis]|uniref:Uncharacterized protein n=1 Tax=Trichostrongylus colubriformis TaxID=6319 RepID=A0AAN8FU64_TRICO
MKLIVLAILAGIVFSTSSSGHTDKEMRTSVRITVSTPRGILKKNGTAKRTSGRRVRSNSTCKWSELKLQPFKEITNSSLRIFLQTRTIGIANTDCILFYQVENNEGGSPYYPFRIDHRTRFLKSTDYGILERLTLFHTVTVDDGITYVELVYEERIRKISQIVQQR